MLSGLFTVEMPPLMGACRALNVLCGVAVCMGAAGRAFETDADTIPLLLVAPAWYFYFTFLTRYSEGEELDEAKKRRVGALVGGIIWLQIAALAVLCVAFPARDDQAAAGRSGMPACRAAPRKAPHAARERFVKGRICDGRRATEEDSKEVRRRARGERSRSLRAGCARAEDRYAALRALRESDRRDRRDKRDRRDRRDKRDKRQRDGAVA